MQTCPSCGEGNPQRARFCLNCGASLVDETAPARMERKFATALFADLVGSTELAEQEDPEVVQSVVGRTFDRLSQEIERFGGHLEKFMGDAVLAVFGIPRTHEDDPERAVRAGLEMQAVLSELNRGFAAEGKPQLEMRVGIESGEVLVDLERATGPRDRMLTGDAVNTAARLQTAADPGHVVVGPGVHAAVKDVISLAELPRLSLKGKADPVPAWDAQAVTAKRRGERPRLGMQARLIGRDEELTVLKQTMQRVESEQRPFLVTVVGPAGVGKSRLIQELADHAEGLPSFYYWRSGRCLAYGNTSYSALADAVKAQCEVLDDDPIEVVHRKVDAAVQELFGDLEVAPALRTLLSTSERSLSREDLFDAWRRFFQRMTARYPLVLVLEDIHWADDGLLDFIEYLSDWAQGSLMVITLARPELFDRRPAWAGGKRNATTISLDPLTPDEDAAMVDDLLPGMLSSELRATIVERAEGNPLFTEEIVRMLIDRGVLRATEASRWEVAAPIAEIDVPRSIQGLIATRLDGLADDEKTVLQDAAVVGREFWLGSIVALTGFGPTPTREILGRLRVKDLIVPNEPSSFGGEQEFAFRHLLLRDGAYDSLPKQLRAEKHEGVARWAAERAGDRADEMAQLIATHTLESLRYRTELGETTAVLDASRTQAYRWTKAAAERTWDLWLNGESMRWYAEAMRLAEVLDLPVQDQLLLAHAYSTSSDGVVPAEERQRIAQLHLDLATRAGDDHEAGAAETTLAAQAFYDGRDDDALRLARSSVTRLEPLGDSPELAEALRTLGWYLWRRGEPLDAAAPLQRAIEIATRVGAGVVLAEATMDLAIARSMVGDREGCIDGMEEAYRLAKETRNFKVMARVCTNYPSSVSIWVSDPSRGREITAEGVELTRKAGATQQLAWLLGNLADFTWMIDSVDEAAIISLEALQLTRTIGDEPLLCMRLASHAVMLTEQGAFDEASAALDEAATILDSNREPQSADLVSWGSGMLAAARMDAPAAAAHFRTAADSVEFIRVINPELLAALVRALIETGDVRTASSYRIRGEQLPPLTTAMGEVIDGLLEADAEEAVRLLGTATDRLSSIPHRPERGRALIDLARAQARAGIDPSRTLDEAVTLLTEIGAVAWLPHVEATRASLLEQLAD